MTSSNKPGDGAAVSRRPYLLRAMHEWIIDSGHTPHVIVDAVRPGVEVPIAYVKDGKIVLTEKRETTGPAVAIRLTADRTEINADGEDVAILKVEGLDKDGRSVPTANNLLAFHVSGDGKLIGVGNGGPNCQESDKDPKRSLFNGLAQIIVQSTKRAGEIHIEAVKEGWEGDELSPAKVTITTTSVESRPAVPVLRKRD